MLNALQLHLMYYDIFDTYLLKLKNWYYSYSLKSIQKTKRARCFISSPYFFIQFKMVVYNTKSFKLSLISSRSIPMYLNVIDWLE